MDTMFCRKCGGRQYGGNESDYCVKCRTRRDVEYILRNDRTGAYSALIEYARKSLESSGEPALPEDLIFEAVWACHLPIRTNFNHLAIEYVAKEDIIQTLKSMRAYQLDSALRKKQRDREDEERYRRRRQGLCQHCGGKFKGFWTLKCRDCGRERDYTD